MAGLGIIWIVVCIISIIIGVCITISPLIIWRNTNRTNRLLALSLAQQGVPKTVITRAWEQSGSDVAHVFGPTAYERNTAAVKQAAHNLKAEATAPDVKPEPAAPTGRYCAACDTTAPLDATSCPTCNREFPAHAVHCPKCGHEITHQPTACPGCGTRYKYKGATSTDATP